MPLTEIPLPPPDATLPENVASFIANTEARIDQLFATEQNKRTPRFLPSDPALFYNALAYITDEKIPVGKTFCEWGSGLGVNTSIASLLGYDAYGLEIETSLVKIAEELAADNAVPSATFVATSYIPEGIETFKAIDGTDLVDPDTPPSHDDLSYEGLPHSADEFDVIFNYPWPGDQDFSHKFFEHIAAEGTVIITYYGDGEITAHVKTAKESAEKSLDDDFDDFDDDDEPGDDDGTSNDDIDDEDEDDRWEN